MTPGKVIAKISDHPELARINKDMDAMVESFKSRSAWLKKQSEALHKDAEKMHKASWDEIKAYLKEKNLIPSDFSDDKDYGTNGIYFDEGILAVRFIQTSDQLK